MTLKPKHKNFGGIFEDIRNMRKFYLVYKDRLDQIRQTTSAKSLEMSQPFQVSWSQYVFLIGIKDVDVRRFYEMEAAENSWTLQELTRQFNSGLYERLALSRDKEGVRKLAREGQVISKPQDMLKNHFFADLVFYNRLLHCYVLIDLKIGKLTHQDMGQMQMYVNYFDRFVKTKEENPTVGIILCQKKRDALVEITLPADANIHAKEYQLYLPSKEELRQKLIDWTIGAE